MTAIDWPQVARLALTSRILDEIEESELVPLGKINYQFSAKGHELGQILLGQHLKHPHDAATVYYRSRPLMLTAGLTLREALAAGFAKTGSPSEGRDVGVVYSMPRRHGTTILPSSGDVGAQYTPAVGWAQAIRYRQNVLGDPAWFGALALAHGGEGSTAANGFWAALNIATTRQLPYLFYIEDNAFAISVRSKLQTPGASISENLQCYNHLLTLSGDGTDPADAAAKIGEAIAYVRAGHGPCLLHLRVVRLMGHTFIDDQGYKTQEERERDLARDPLTHLKAFLPDLDWAGLEKQVASEIRAAIDAALSQPDPEPDSAPRHLFYEGIPQQVGGILPEAAATAPQGQESEPGPGLRVNLIDAVRRTLESEMSANPRLLVFGEDVGAKGGVHGATAHMQARFGEERVFDTSLSEEGIMGSAAGLALAGLLPVPEIQFRKYADPATEQINDIGTLRWRTANKFAAPMVVRIPVGFGKKTGDPWHSVSGEAIYAHTLGWRLAYPSNAEDAAGLLRTALRGNDPVIFFEHRALLDTPQARRAYPSPHFLLPFGRAATLKTGDRLTVVTWGAMVYASLEAAQTFDRQVEVLDLRTIVPWDAEAVLQSVRKTGKCLVVHEDTLTGGFAGEIIATIAEQAFEWLDAPVKRLASPDCPIPYNAGLMSQVIPSASGIASAISNLISF